MLLRTVPKAFYFSGSASVLTPLFLHVEVTARTQKDPASFSSPLPNLMTDQTGGEEAGKRGWPRIEQDKNCREKEIGLVKEKSENLKGRERTSLPRSSLVRTYVLHEDKEIGCALYSIWGRIQNLSFNPFLHPKGLCVPWPLQGLLSTTCLKQKMAGFLSNCSFLCLLYVEILTQCKLIIFFKKKSFFSEVSKTRVCVNFRVCRK